MTFNWAVAHKMAMMAANHAHDDTGVARDEYVDVFAALRAGGIFCIAKPLQGLAGVYAGPASGGPAVMLSSALGEVAMRHTAGHELGHHVFGHGTVLDDRVDPDAGTLGAPLPDEEKLAEAFAAWFLMPLPAVRSAMRRSGIGQPGGPEDVHQIACWLGTSFAGTARHLVNLRLAEMRKAEEWNRAWRNSNGRIRAALCGSRTPPPGRVWVLGPGAHRVCLHVLPGDSLVYPGGGLPDVLPAGLAGRTEQQLGLESRAVVAVTRVMNRSCQLTVPVSGADVITVTLVPPPLRSGIDSAWHAREEPPSPHTEEA